ERDASRLSALARSMPAACRAVARRDGLPAHHPRDLLQHFLDATIDALAREALPPAAQPGRRSQARPARERSPAEAWLAGLRGQPIVETDSSALGTFEREYRTWIEPAAAAVADTFRVCFRLEPPAPEPEPGPVPSPTNGDRRWSLEYLLQATDDPSLLVPAGE